MKWFIKCLRQYADFNGRARRKEFWWFTLVNFIVIVVLILTAFILSPDSDEDNLYTILYQNPLGWIAIVYTLAMLVPSLAVTVRRLHDTGCSGWWILLFLGVDMLDTIGDEMDGSPSLVFSLVVIGINIIYLIWMFTDSEDGPNQWGKNPKEMDAAEVETEK